MSRFQNEYGFRHDRSPKLGILIANLGSPDEPTPKAVRRYLAEFLWDKRVVEIPRPLWWLILNLVVLNVRPKKSAALYQSIWTEHGSPLLVHSQNQAEKIRGYFDKHHPGRVAVSLGMRYGNPSVESALEELHGAGAQRILVLPLYPQYSATTTATLFDKVADLLKKRRLLPELRFINHYHDHPGYIDAMATQIHNYWAENGRTKFFVLSFHGLPHRCLKQGDPYFCECQKTARLLAEKLELDDDQWKITFQSRFGREEWLKPYTDKSLEELAREGKHDVDVYCPGFSADCLETLEEIAETNRDVFLQAGGKNYRYIPALNASEAHISFLTNLIETHVQGWPELSDKKSIAQLKIEALARLDRAHQQGASE